jgi:hypothetical protein
MRLTLKNKTLSWPYLLFGVVTSFCYFGVALGANVIRTPAKLYGSAYSVKLKVVKGDFEWVLPMWVKPDQKKSSLDPGIMRLMGWTGARFEFDQVSLSGTRLPILKFESGKADWFASREFTKNCCAGVIGQDILSQFVTRFDPRTPVHILWTQIYGEVHPAPVTPASSLSSLFNIQSKMFGRRDLSQTPYVLDLRQKEIRFE